MRYERYAGVLLFVLAVVFHAGAAERAAVTVAPTAAPGPPARQTAPDQLPRETLLDGHLLRAEEAIRQREPAVAQTPSAALATDELRAAYLGAASAVALPPSSLRQPTLGEEPLASPPSVPAPQHQPSPPSGSEVDIVFWQSIMNSTNPAEFEAYLAQFPNGTFRALAEVRLAALRAPPDNAPSTGQSTDGTAPPPAGWRFADVPGVVSGGVGGARTPMAAAVDAYPGTVLQLDELCTAIRPAQCWMQVSGQSGCYAWNQSVVAPESVTWTGTCVRGLAQGTGSLTWSLAAVPGGVVSTGQLQDGKPRGHWVTRAADGSSWEGPYVDETRHGHWVDRYADGRVEEGTYVNGERHGHWVERDAGVGIAEGSYTEGNRTGRWVERYTNGDVFEGSFDGAVGRLKTGHWVERYADGRVEEGRYTGGYRVGVWTIRRPNGRTEVLRFVNGRPVAR